MDTSSFSDIQQTYPDAELLPVGVSTCDCYRVRLYGKLHFLKRLKPELRTNPRYVAALKKEFETGYNLEHPHLVRYASVGDDSLLTEYVDGETLTQFATSHPDYFRIRKNTDRFLSQLLDVVGYLHQHQIVHLDLKPSNILITRIDHSVKLVDLGYCYTDTYTDTMGRTDKYAAPEQLDGSGSVDARTDIFAIGRILQTLPCAHKNNKVIARCTAESPSNRYQTIEELQKALIKKGHRWWVWLPLIPLAMLLLIMFFPRFAVDKSRETQGDSLIQIKGSVTTTSKPESPSVIVPYEASAPSSQRESLQATSEADYDETLHEDTLSLRKELQTIAQPIFNRMLGAYRDSSYKAVEYEKMSVLNDEFRNAIMTQYHKLWEKYRRKGTISEHTFYNECAQTWLFYVNNLYYEMCSNDGNYDYDGKVYHYYDDQKY